jgi:hypothetical protein
MAVFSLPRRQNPTGATSPSFFVRSLGRARQRTGQDRTKDGACSKKISDDGLDRRACFKMKYLKHPMFHFERAKVWPWRTLPTALAGEQKLLFPMNNTKKSLDN